jgi:hypothetical protein
MYVISDSVVGKLEGYVHRKTGQPQVSLGLHIFEIS